MITAEFDKNGELHLYPEYEIEAYALQQHIEVHGAIRFHGLPVNPCEECGEEQTPKVLEDSKADGGT